jgi:copper chaperone CopZ
LEQRKTLKSNGVKFQILQVVNQFKSKNKMNTISKIITIIFLLATQIGFAQIKNAKTETVKIYGNCGGCEKTIEKAGNLKKEATVDWNKDTKLATITYNTNKTNRDEILKRIALVGYDSDTYLAPEASYEKLAKCCQYDRTAKSESIAEMPEMSHAAMNHSMIDAPQTSVGENNLKQVFSHYFELKDALVASDAGSSAKHATTLQMALLKVEMNKLTDESHQVWMKVMKPLTQNAKVIAGTNDVKKQRRAFINLSADMYELMKASKVDEPVYVQFCPMANNGEGANWLSKESAVENPYYGSMMLTCGSVKETIK